jgi:hypothetical protein
MAPVPDATTAEPTVAVHEERITPTGSGTSTIAPDTGDGPALVTVTVYVSWLPGMYVVWPSVIET